MCGTWGWRLRPELPDVPPSHPLCTAFLQYHLHVCRDKQLADALSRHITSGPCHRRDPVPLAPSVPFLPGPSCSFQLPFCLCPSGQVFFCSVFSLSSVSLCLHLSPSVCPGGLPVFSSVSHLGFISDSFSHSLLAPTPLLPTAGEEWRPGGDQGWHTFGFKGCLF